MPTTCWNSVPPKETNMLSMRNSSINDLKNQHTSPKVCILLSFLSYIVST
jgi:hypothetical protein